MTEYYIVYRFECSYYFSDVTSENIVNTELGGADALLRQRYSQSRRIFDDG